MIDFGLTKMMLIGVVALVVIGPEKLPRVARMAGSLFGRAQRYINDVKAEVSREMELDELRKVHEEVQKAAGDVQQSIASSLAETRSELNAAWSGHGDEQPNDAALQAPDVAQMARKSKDFRKKRMARDAVPAWYKQKNGHKTRVISAAARVARYRPSGMTSKSTFFH
jgi:sec-independent protein translocase protein TatB